MLSNYLDYKEDPYDPFEIENTEIGQKSKIISTAN